MFYIEFYYNIKRVCYLNNLRILQLICNTMRDNSETKKNYFVYH